MSKTVILGATPNTDRYAYFAAERLHNNSIPFVPVGIKSGEVLGRPILDLRQKPIIKEVHTVTLYIGPANQKEWEDYILSLNPKRVIFNPGTENPSFMKKLHQAGIEAEAACTLVMLGTGTY
jgi:predicted CoA-binding protein